MSTTKTKTDPVETARQRALASLSRQSVTPGKVLGGDYKQYRYAVIDLDAGAGKATGLRAELELRGYTRVEPTPEVVGINRPEVWSIPRAVFDEVLQPARQSRDADRMRAAGINILIRRTA
jgi:hypothetical protein